VRDPVDVEAAGGDVGRHQHAVAPAAETIDPRCPLCQRPIGGERPRRSAEWEEAAMVMVLPFVMGLLAALVACYGRAKAALTLGLATVAVQVWWLIYHATDSLRISL
jgi:hypothetical protein